MPLARFIKYPLIFKKPAGTSRGVLHEKESWFLILNDPSQPQRLGIGECSVIPGLSLDDRNEIESVLKSVCEALNHGTSGPELHFFPAVRFALETAILDFDMGGQQYLYPSGFTEAEQGIPINGLIWMGDKSGMLDQVAQKIDQGFSVLKLKVGALDFEDEISIVEAIRDEHPASELDIRLDANGAWREGEAIGKLERLSSLHIHSVEQPIRPGEFEEMAEVCRISPIPIALDEELITILSKESREKLIDTVQPHYIIIKPSLLGGIEQSREWISIAGSRNVQWWITSALESNIGLNAIAQWTATLDTKLPQGLGTGSLFTNNIPSPLEIRGEKLYHLNDKPWDLSGLKGGAI